MAALGTDPVFQLSNDCGWSGTASWAAQVVLDNLLISWFVVPWHRYALWFSALILLHFMLFGTWERAFVRLALCAVAVGGLFVALFFVVIYLGLYLVAEQTGYGSSPLFEHAATVAWTMIVLVSIVLLLAFRCSRSFWGTFRRAFPFFVWVFVMFLLFTLSAVLGTSFFLILFLRGIVAGSYTDECSEAIQELEMHVRQGRSSG